MTGTKDELDDFVGKIQWFPWNNKIYQGWRLWKKNKKLFGFDHKDRGGGITNNRSFCQSHHTLFISHSQEQHRPTYHLNHGIHHKCARTFLLSLGFRLRRTCSEEDDFTRRLAELKEVLMSRGYKSRAIDGTFIRVKKLIWISPSNKQHSYRGNIEWANSWKIKTTLT